jgi:hypothetical protein
MRTMSANELALNNAIREPIPVARFRAPDGSLRTVAVTEVEGGWWILDQDGGEPTVVDTLTHREDGLEQAEAVARDYARRLELPRWARE